MLYVSIPRSYFTKSTFCNKYLNLCKWPQSGAVDIVSMDILLFITRTLGPESKSIFLCLLRIQCHPVLFSATDIYDCDRSKFTVEIPGGWCLREWRLTQQHLIARKYVKLWDNCLHTLLTSDPTLVEPKDF